MKFIVPIALIVLLMTLIKRMSAKNQTAPKDDKQLSHEQLSAVADIYYADLDANCWFVGVTFANGDVTRFAVESEMAAKDFATELSMVVAKRCGRTLTVGKH